MFEPTKNYSWNTIIKMILNSSTKKWKKYPKLEHDADDIRRKMEIEFFKGAFLPFDREDRIILAEDVDSVADIIQETAFGICLARINFPSGYKEDFSMTYGINI